MSRHCDRCFRSSSVPSMARRRKRAARPILETCEPRALLSYSAIPVGYEPAQIQQAYSFNQISFNQGAIKGDGAGQTIAIVDAYDDPDFVTSTHPSTDANFQASDLAAFDREFGIPDPPSFTKYTETGQVIDNQAGQTSSLVPTDPAGIDSNPPNWEAEEALDVEWAHAMAPAASIDLIEATSSLLYSIGPSGNTVPGDLLIAVETAQDLAGVSVVSMSWGGKEDGTALGLDPDFSHSDVAFVASASDAGQFAYPAASPNVLGVGGTTLTLNASGNYGSESVWVDSGGGPDPNNPGKLGPDVGYNAGQNFADQLTGFAVHDQYNGSNATPWTMVNGTSAGAPQWAALIAIADQGRALEGLAPLGSKLLLSIIDDMPSSDFHIPNSEPLTNEDGFTGSQVYGKGSPIANLVGDALLQQVLVTKVGTTAANGTYGIGSTIDIQLSFDLPVTVTGVPNLALNSGGTARYQSGSGTNTLTFAYTVGPNQNSNRLDCTAMSLSGGTIKDSFGDAASLSLPVSGAPGSLSANSDIVIATPTPAVTQISSTTPNGTYGFGTTIDITVNFSGGPVTVTGVPQLALNSGGTASYQSGSGTSTLTFIYTVGLNQSSSHLDCTGLSLKGGAIEDGFGDAASLNLPAQGASGSLGANTDIVIATAPTVTSVSATTANGDYTVGKTIGITVTFSSVVYVSPGTNGSVPALALNSGGVGSYSSGSGTNTLTFTYTVAAGQNANPLDELSSGALSLNGGTIKDGPGDTANLTLPAQGAAGSLGVNNDIIIDTTAPTVTGISSTTASGTYTYGAVIDITVGWSEAVYVNTATGKPELALNDGIASYSTGSGTNTLTFTFTVSQGCGSVGQLDEASTTALTLDGGTIVDAAGNAAKLAVPAPGTGGSLAGSRIIGIDTTVVSSVASLSANSTYGTGAIIDLKVSFNQPVNVIPGANGSMPALELNSGGIAVYFSGAGTDNLTFSYTVQPGQSASRLDVLSPGALILSGGSAINNTYGAPAHLTLPAAGAAGSLGANANIVVDATSPTVTGISSTSAYGAEFLGSGVIDITVTFSKVVYVTTSTGSPDLALNDGGMAVYSSGSGTNTLTFTYTVGAGQNANPLDVLSTSALALNGSTIRDGLHNTANLALPTPGTTGSLAVNRNIVVDTQPSVTSITSPDVGYPNVVDGLGNAIDIDVTFNKAVDITGWPELQLNDGGVAIYSTGAGTSTLTFMYIPLSGQNWTLPLDVSAPAGALIFHGGAIADNLGLAANLTVVGDSLPSRDFIINTPALVTSVSATSPGGLYGPGETIDVTVTFNKVVYFSNTSYYNFLRLNDGGVANYSGGSGTNTLTFSYTVGPGQNANPLDEASTTALGLNNPVTDYFGLAADLTLPAPGTTGSLGANKDIDISQLAADERFINRLYEDFLNRSAYADPQGMAQWVNELESLEQQGDSLATARSIVVSGIARSTEALNDVVNQMYQAFLKRAADSGGLGYWEGQLASGATEEQVMANLLASGEFQSDTNNLQFVNQWYGSSNYAAGNWNWNYIIGLYEIVLKRPPSYQEAVSWYNALPSLGYYQVAYDFLASAEFRTDAVQTFYGTQAQTFQPFVPDLLDRYMLGEGASSAEIAYWVNSTQPNGSPTDLLSIEIAIASSQEYYNDAPND
jgi:hypothetical protein